jgi:hypothetical protein
VKSVIQALTLAAALAVPVAVLAQSNSPVTRAQVRAELVQLEQAGYNPSRGENAHYPDDIQAAEAKVAAANHASDMGGTADGSSESGERAATGNALNRSLYVHH